MKVQTFTVRDDVPNDMIGELRHEPQLGPNAFWQTGGR